MILAQVKGIYTVDGDNLENHVPEDPKCFCIVVRVLIGPRGTEGDESFDIKVCTPQWLELEIERRRFLIGRHYLFVGDYRPEFIRATLTRFIEHCSGDSWQEVAKKISRIAYWEFEDY